VADDREAAKLQRIGELDGVLRHRYDLAGTHGIFRQKRRIAKTAQIRSDGEKSGGLERGRYTVISAYVVGPAVQE
jgi:hypothetical protein